MTWRELYRDDCLVAVDKPSGLLTHRGLGRDPVALMDLLREHYGQRLHPLHRLDRGTSGVLLVALSPEIAAQLQAQFRSGLVRKTYLALVRGIPADRGSINQPLPREEGGERVPALTHFRRLHVIANRYSLVEAQPVTGRLHQVRRHLKHISCPVIGDANYGKSEHNSLWRNQYGLRRLALHAAAIEFSHPHHAGRMHLEAPLADDFRQALARAGLLFPL